MRPIPLRLGAGREARTVDHDHGAAVRAPRAPSARPRRARTRAVARRTDRRATRADGPSAKWSWNDSIRPECGRRTGRRPRGRRDGSSAGAIRRRTERGPRRTPSASHRRDVGAVVDPVRRQVVVACRGEAGTPPGRPASVADRHRRRGQTPRGLDRDLLGDRRGTSRARNLRTRRCRRAAEPRGTSRMPRVRSGTETPDDGQPRVYPATVFDSAQFPEAPTA